MAGQANFVAYSFAYSLIPHDAVKVSYQLLSEKIEFSLIDSMLCLRMPAPSTQFWSTNFAVCTSADEGRCLLLMQIQLMLSTKTFHSTNEFHFHHDYIWHLFAPTIWATVCRVGLTRHMDFSTGHGHRSCSTREEKCRIKEKDWGRHREYFGLGANCTCFGIWLSSWLMVMEPKNPLSGRGNSIDPPVLLQAKIM